MQKWEEDWRVYPVYEDDLRERTPEEEAEALRIVRMVLGWQRMPGRRRVIALLKQILAQKLAQEKQNDVTL